MLRFLLGIIFAGCAIIIIFPLYTFYIYTHPKKYITPVTPEHLGLEFSEVSFQAEDGLSLSGWMIPNKNSDSIIIVCHGYPADKGDLLELASFLKDDYNLFFFDFRGLGQSGGNQSTLGNKERLDFAASVDFVKKLGFKKIGALGFSMGGAVIIMTNSSDIKAAVTDSAFSDLENMVDAVFYNFGPFKKPFTFMTKLYSKIFLKTDISHISPVKHIPGLKFPLLIIHAENDDVVPVENARLLHEADISNELWIVPGAVHGQAYNVAGNNYRNKVKEFYRINL